MKKFRARTYIHTRTLPNNMPPKRSLCRCPDCFCFDLQKIYNRCFQKCLTVSIKINIMQFPLIHLIIARRKTQLMTTENLHNKTFSQRIKDLFGQIDLTQGSIVKVLIKFTLPINRVLPIAAALHSLGRGDMRTDFKCGRGRGRQRHFTPRVHIHAIRVRLHGRLLRGAFKQTRSARRGRSSQVLCNAVYSFARLSR